MDAVSAIEPAGSGTDAFRIRRFVERLEEAGELERIAAPTDLIDVARHLDGNRRAVLFEAAGPEKAELVGNVMGGRRRLAMALGVDPEELLQTVIERLRGSIAPVEVASADAPCQEVVWEGEDADFTRLPVHLQHEFDGAPYISAGIDITSSLDGTKRNVGYRRIMLRGRREAGIDLVAPSDLRGMYAPFVREDERMPMAFVVGSHPADGIAATSMTVHDDELGVMGSVRGAPVPLVKCVTIDARVPADAEFVLEGYLDGKGWREGEGPYGEYVGYYGHMKINPVFHLTAITRRRDALFQTLTIGGRHLECTDTAQLCALRTEAAVWQALETAVRNPRGVYVTPSCGGMFNARICIEQNYPGEARNAISAVLGSKADVKHVSRSIPTSTSSPTSRWTGLWRPVSRRTGISSRPAVTARFRWTLRSKAPASAPRRDSISPFLSGGIRKPTTSCRNRRALRPEPRVRCWRRCRPARGPSGISWRRPAAATAARS